MGTERNGNGRLPADSAVVPLCVILAARVSMCLEPNGHLPLFVVKLSNVQIELEAAAGRNIIMTMITSRSPSRVDPFCSVNGDGHLCRLFLHVQIVFCRLSLFHSPHRFLHGRAGRVPIMERDVHSITEANGVVTSGLRILTIAHDNWWEPSNVW